MSGPAVRCPRSAWQPCVRGREPLGKQLDAGKQPPAAVNSAQPRVPTARPQEGPARAPLGHAGCLYARAASAGSRAFPLPPHALRGGGGRAEAGLGCPTAGCRRARQAPRRPHCVRRPRGLGRLGPARAARGGAGVGRRKEAEEGEEEEAAAGSRGRGAGGGPGEGRSGICGARRRSREPAGPRVTESRRAPAEPRRRTRLLEELRPGQARPHSRPAPPPCRRRRRRGSAPLPTPPPRPSPGVEWESAGRRGQRRDPAGDTAAGARERPRRQRLN